jgi:hypothetical protein
LPMSLNTATKVAKRAMGGGKERKLCSNVVRSLRSSFKNRAKIPK